MEGKPEKRLKRRRSVYVLLQERLRPSSVCSIASMNDSTAAQGPVCRLKTENSNVQSHHEFVMLLLRH